MFATRSLLWPRPLRVPVRFMRTKIRSGIKKPVVSEKSALKYDPLDTTADFMSYNILPFFQAKLNALVPEDRQENLCPTADQRRLLAVLRSSHSAILRGQSDSGKATAIALHALSISVSSSPRYGFLEQKSKQESWLESVIVVPSDQVVSKYAALMKALVKDIPEKCCPGQIELENETQSVVYSPLSIQYNYSDGSVEKYSSGEEEFEVPHILVATPSALETLLSEKTIPESAFSGVQFVAADNMDFQVAATDIGGLQNLSHKRPKKKYQSKLKKSIKQIQNLHFQQYSDSLLKRLKLAERKLTEKSSFNHAQFVFDTPDLSTEYVNSTLAKAFENEDEKPNIFLLKKLIKVKRKLLYKPIQYCFTVQPTPPMVESINSMASPELTFGGLEQEAFRKSRDVRSDLDIKLQSTLSRYVDGKQKTPDETVQFIERLVRFDDEKRSLKKEERQLMLTGKYNLLFTNVEVFVVDKKARDIRFTESRQQFFTESVKEAKRLGGNIKNSAKHFLKEQEPKKVTKKSIEAVLTAFNLPFMVVVPPYVDLSSLTIAKPHKAVHPHEILGQTFDYNHFLVVGIECLLPQLAFSNWKQQESITGIELARMDLCHFYITKLASRPDSKIVFQDLENTEKLKEIVLQNDFPVSSIADYTSNES